MKILVVDDSSLTRSAVVTALQAFNHEVVGEGKDGNEALELYKKSKPDIVLLDLAMPNKDGLETIREIRDFDPNAVIVAVSALYDRAIQRRALELGAKAYVVKPFELSELMNVIEKIKG
ncbi:MAG: response regulator [Methanomassiliicoccales archaeon]